MPSAFPRPSRETLERLYCEENKSAGAIARIYKCSGTTVTKWLKDDNLPIRPRREANALRWEKDRLRFIKEPSVTEGQFDDKTEIAKIDPQSLADSPQTDDLDSAYLRLSYKQRAYVDIITDLDPEQVRKTPQEIAAQLKIDPETIKAWRRLPDVLAAIEEVSRPENKSRLGELYRRSLLNKFHTGRDTKEDRKLAAEIVGDLKPQQFNTAVQVNIKTTDW